MIKIAVLDACVLDSVLLRDLLLWLGYIEVFRHTGKAQGLYKTAVFLWEHRDEI